jgi:hypothetical protein
MNTSRQPLHHRTALMLSFLMTGILAGADLGLKNGDFTTGKQFWRGDGTVVTLPDGNKVIEMASNPRRQDQVYQDIEMGTLTQVEVKFRARFIGGKGQMRAKLMKKNGGSTLFAFDLPPDGEWRDISFKHVRENQRDERSLVLETLPYEGKLQIDDVWSGEPGTHTSERPMVPTTAPPKPPAAVPMPALPTPAPIPETPTPIITASPSAGFALDKVLEMLPAPSRSKLMAAKLAQGTFEEVNAIFAADFKNKQIQASFVVAKVEKPEGKRLRILAANGVLSGQYPALKHMFWTYFDEGTEPSPTQMPSEGDMVTVSGTITRCDLVTLPIGGRFCVDLHHSRLVNTTATTGAQAANPVELKLSDSDWAWGSGGTLKLARDGTATHTSWKSAGSWKLNSDETLSIQRPGNDPPMTVIFTDSDFLNGDITSHTGAKTTIKRVNK